MATIPASENSKDDSGKGKTAHGRHAAKRAPRESSLYERLSPVPELRDRIIDATLGLGCAESMTDDMKRDWLDQFTMDDMEFYWANGLV